MALFTQYPYSRPSVQTKYNATSRLGPAAILDRRDVPELRELVALRSKGWDDESLDHYFKGLRQIADSPSKQAEYTWYKNMRSIMQELDRAAHFVPTSNEFRFLDIGCAPGGFSSYLLMRNRRATGTGISLPECSGGHPLLLEEHFLSRYQHVQEDILRYDLSPLSLNPVDDHSRVRLPDALTGCFPIVVLDGHALRTYRHDTSLMPPESNADWLKAAHGAYRDRLLITQLIIALEAVSLGGTIVTRLSHIECFPAAPLLYLLDSISDDLVVHKPQMMHRTRGTFYVIAKGVCRSQEKASLGKRYLQELKAVWAEIQRDGPYEGIGRMLDEDDLNSIAPAKVILDQYVDRLVELGRQTWSTQVEGLRALFKKKGVM